MISCYFALKFYFTKKIKNVFFSSIFFALGAASKISAIYFLPLLLFFICLQAIKSLFAKKEHEGKLFRQSLEHAPGLRLVLICLIFFVVSLIVFRFSAPYYFKDGNILNLQISPLFLENIKTLKYYDTPDAWYPPAVQWVHKPPVLYSLYNLAFYGVGIIYFFFILIGIFYLVKKHKNVELIAILTWIIIFFIYQSTQFVKTMRYFIFLFPFFALFAGIGFYYFTISWGKTKQGALILLLLIYPLSFISIYVHPVSRVSASAWIYQHVPSASFLLNEHWDDPLPIGGHISYAGELLPVFDPDTPEKWKKMNELLAKGDYLILSSGRGWSNIPTVPERYPRMTKFYNDLLADKLQYKKIKEFTSYPSLRYLGIPLDFPDDWAEEPFTVYDHPKVMIFKKAYLP